jgi:hypothetical protein
VCTGQPGDGVRRELFSIAGTALEAGSLGSQCFPCGPAGRRLRLAVCQLPPSSAGLALLLPPPADASHEAREFGGRAAD